MKRRPNGYGCISNGYKRIKKNGKYFFEHRIIMEEHLKRKITNKEIVHHINGNTLDNRIENLIVTTRPSHAKLHYFTDKSKQEQFKSIQKLGPISPRQYGERIVVPHIQPPKPSPTIEGQVWHDHKARKAYIVIKCKICNKLLWRRKDYKLSKGFCQLCSGRNANSIKYSKSYY